MKATQRPSPKISGGKRRSGGEPFPRFVCNLAFPDRPSATPELPLFFSSNPRDTVPAGVDKRIALSSRNDIFDQHFHRAAAARTRISNGACYVRNL